MRLKRPFHPRKQPPTPGVWDSRSESRGSIAHRRQTRASAARPTPSIELLPELLELARQLLQFEPQIGDLPLQFANAVAGHRPARGRRG